MKQRLNRSALNLVLVFVAAFVLSACATSPNQLRIGQLSVPQLYDGEKDQLAKSAKEAFDKIDISAAFDVERENLKNLLTQEIAASDGVRDSQLRLRLWRFASSQDHSFWDELAEAQTRLSQLGYGSYLTWRNTRSDIPIALLADDLLSETRANILAETKSDSSITEDDVSCATLDELTDKIDANETLKTSQALALSKSQFSKACALQIDKARNPFLSQTGGAETTLLGKAYEDWQTALEDIEILEVVKKNKGAEIKLLKKNSAGNASIGSATKSASETSIDENVKSCTKPEGCGSKIAEILAKDRILSLPILLNLVDEDSRGAKQVDAIGTVVSAIASGGVSEVCPTEPDAEETTAEADTKTQNKACDELKNAFAILLNEDDQGGTEGEDDTNEVADETDDSDFLAIQSFSGALKDYRAKTAKAPTAALLVQLSQLQTQQKLTKTKIVLARRRADLARARFIALRSEADALGELQQNICNFAVWQTSKRHPYSDEDPKRDLCPAFLDKINDNRGLSPVIAQTHCSEGASSKDTDKIGHCSWKDVLSADSGKLKDHEKAGKRWALRAVAARARAERARAEAEANRFRIADLYHQETLEAGLFAIESHNNLVDGGITQLAAYFENLPKPSQIGNLAFQAAAVAGIANEIGD